MADDKGKIETLALDMSLDDIEDMPGFVTPPTGAYHVIIEEVDANKEISDNVPLAIDYKFKIVSVTEFDKDQLDLGENEPKEGDMFNLFWSRSNKFALGNFKEFVKPLAERLGVTKLQEILDGSKGMSLLMILKRTKNKTSGNWNLKIVKSAVL